MNHLELRHLGALLRPGHLFTATNGQQYEVVSKTYSDHVICTKKDDDSDSVNWCMVKLPLTEVVLSENQITPADRERVAQQIDTRRQEFLRNLPPKCQQYTYANLKINEGNRYAVERCQNLLCGTNLFIYGDVGNGKTMLAVASAYELAAYYSVAVWGVVELFTKIRASFNVHNRTERPDLRRPEVLVLDDIGKSKASDFVYEELYGIVNYRWEHGKTTIFTSNHGAFATAQKVSPDVDNAGALLSRMASGDVVKVTGRDQRVLQGKIDVSIQDS